MTSLIPINSDALVRASSDDQLIELWVARQGSERSRGYYRRVAGELLAGVPGIRAVKLEDVHKFLELHTGKAPNTQATYLAIVKSLLSFAHDVGYTQYNVGKAIKIRGRGEVQAERILSESDVTRLLDATRSLPPRYSLILRLIYYAGLRVSEVTGLKVQDVKARESANKVQISVLGKGSKVRSVVLPDDVGQEVLETARDRPGGQYLFQGVSGGRMHSNTVLWAVKTAASRAGLGNRSISPHWLRHAHASHAIDRGAPISLVKATLGHSSVATTSQYLHAAPDDSSGLYLRKT